MQAVMPEVLAVIPSPEEDREPNARLARAIRRLRSDGAREAGALTLRGPSGEAVGILTESALQALEAALIRLAETDEVMLGSRDTDLIIKEWLRNIEPDQRAR